ncbi:MAG: TonB-dependent siderophore receptor [Pseudomonadota bacterium]
MLTPRRLPLAIALLAASATTQAQQDDAAELAPLTVTGQAATKTETPFNETPQATSVVENEEWEERGAETVQRAADYTTGTFTNQIGASNRYDYLVLRGFSDGSVSNTFLDGLKVMGDAGSYSSMSIDPYFLERIEVVKGPASVLYGRASPGGLVGLTSKRPAFERAGEVRLGVGNNAQRSAAFDLTGPIDDERRVAFRLTGLARAADTQFGPVEEKRYALAPQVSWDISDATSLTLHAYLQKDPEGGYHAGLPYEGSVVDRNGRRIDNTFFEGEDDHDDFERTQRMFGYEFEHRFNDSLTARQRLRYLNSDVDHQQVYATGWASETELSRGYLTAQEDLEAWVVDNQLQADVTTGSIDHRLLLGADYQQRTTLRSESFGGLAPIDAFAPEYGAEPVGVTPFYDAERDLEQTGIYVQDQMQIGNWHLALGGRYDWVDIHNVDTLQGTDERLDDTQFSGRAGILYAFDNGISPFVNYTTSFSPNSVSDENGDILKPTEGEQVETGLKYQPIGSDSHYTLALFDITQENIATRTNPSDPFRAVGETESRGIELEAHTQVTDNLSLKAGYSYTDATYEKSDVADEEGNNVVWAPKHIATLWGNYRFSQGALKGFDAGLGIRHHADIQANRSNTKSVPDYTLVDATLGYDLGGLGLEGVSARLNASNLLDKDYVASCLSETYCYFGAERSIQASVSYDF